MLPTDISIYYKAAFVNIFLLIFAPIFFNVSEQVIERVYAAWSKWGWDLITIFESYAKMVGLYMLYPLDHHTNLLEAASELRCISTVASHAFPIGCTTRL